MELLSAPLPANCALFLMALVIFKFGSLINWWFWTVTVAWFTAICTFDGELGQNKFPKAIPLPEADDEDEEELCFKLDVTWSTDNCFWRILLPPQLLPTIGLSLECCVLSSIDFCLQNIFFAFHCCCRMLDIPNTIMPLLLLLLLALCCYYVFRQYPNIFMILLQQKKMFLRSFMEYFGFPHTQENFAHPNVKKNKK